MLFGFDTVIVRERAFGGLCGEFMLKPVGLNAEVTLLKRNWETQIGYLFTLRLNQEAKASGDLV
jgi:hypothetical protein